MRTYYVYIVASRSRRLYIGVTGNLLRRIHEHKMRTVEGFTHRYYIHRLVYFEDTNDVRVALEREKELKGWRRERKIALIESSNPEWKDLAEEWFPPVPDFSRFNL